MTIEPALTPEEWVEFLDPSNEWAALAYHNKGNHEAAAVGLYGQPFGFTWEDVDVLIQSGGYRHQPGVTFSLLRSCPHGSHAKCKQPLCFGWMVLLR